MPGFIWTSANIAAATKHGVSTDEAEHVVRHESPPWPEKITTADDVYLVWGRTSAGGYVEVIYRMLTDDSNIEFEEVESVDLDEGGDTVLIFHARPLTDSEKKRYRRGSRR